MIVIKDKAKASQLRRELAAELNKKPLNMEEISRIRAEIMKAGGHVGHGLAHVQKWSRNADC
jgi:hypothetical protein